MLCNGASSKATRNTSSSSTDCKGYDNCKAALSDEELASLTVTSDARDVDEEGLASLAWASCVCSKCEETASDASLTVAVCCKATDACIAPLAITSAAVLLLGEACCSTTATAFSDRVGVAVGVKLMSAVPMATVVRTAAAEVALAVTMAWPASLEASFCTTDVPKPEPVEPEGGKAGGNGGFGPPPEKIK